MVFSRTSSRITITWRNSVHFSKQNCSGEDGFMRSRRDIPLTHTVSYGPIRRLHNDKEKIEFSTFYHLCGSNVWDSISAGVIPPISFCMWMQVGSRQWRPSSLGGCCWFCCWSQECLGGCGSAPGTSIQRRRRSSLCPTFTTSQRSPHESGIIWSKDGKIHKLYKFHQNIQFWYYFLVMNLLFRINFWCVNVKLCCYPLFT